MTRMAINPGIPIPSAMSSVSLERPFNGANDGMVDGVIREDNNVVADDEDPKLDKAVVEPKVSVGIVIFRS